jgi:hypothetical protein
MKFQARQFTRNGVIHANASVEAVFPMLCPKREEEWIPGWECETLWSRSGYNEEGAIFRTVKPYGTELYWTTLRYDRRQRVVDFLITAPHLFVFRFLITLDVRGPGPLILTFMQTFTSVSEKGNAFLERYQADDFASRLRSLEEFMQRYLQNNRPS